MKLVPQCYATPLPQLTDEVKALAARVEKHLRKMENEKLRRENGK